MVAAGGLLSSATSSSGSARYYPFFLTAIVFALAIAELVTDQAGPEDEDEDRLAGVRELLTRNARGLGVTGLVICLWLVIPRLGFFTSVAPMLVLSAVLLGVSWIRAVVFAGVIVTLAYLLFVHVVAISLPTGLFY